VIVWARRIAVVEEFAGNWIGTVPTGRDVRRCGHG
jgi:hypothetical protein